MQRARIARDDRLTLTVAPGVHDLGSCAPDAVNEPPVAGKDPAVERLVPASLAERGVVLEECHRIERCAGGKAHRSRPRWPPHLPPACERRLEQAPTGRGPRCGSEYVAGPVREALGIFERAQLLRRVDAHVGVGADAAAPPGGNEAGGREDAIAEIRLG